MSSFHLTTPVVLLVFNRPAQTARVFAAIREARPVQLLIIADGPREGHPDDGALCAEVRRIIAQVDWPCEVVKNYSDVNLGCKYRPITGLDWAFGLIDEAIILEDDCLPDPSFFRFCQELLQFYRDDERVMMICGTNWLGTFKAERPQSYSFTHYDCVWGWASWRRAWRLNDGDLSLWGDQAVKDRVRSTLRSDAYYRLRAATFDQVWQNKVVTWDYQWGCSRLINGGLAIVPSINLVANIGYGANATHTIVLDEELASIATGRAAFPLVHPDATEPDLEYDLRVVDMMRRKKSLVARVVRLWQLIGMRTGAKGT